MVKILGLRLSSTARRVRGDLCERGRASEKDAKMTEKIGNAGVGLGKLDLLRHHLTRRQQPYAPSAVVGRVTMKRSISDGV